MSVKTETKDRVEMLQANVHTVESCVTDDIGHEPVREIYDPQQRSVTARTMTAMGSKMNEMCAFQKNQ